MSRLLVSVRSAEEARAAIAGGADVIDVKEPARGALGRAEVSVWRAVRAALPSEIPVSVALGELTEWRTREPVDCDGLSFRKLGLAGAGPNWVGDWARLRARLGSGPAWVAVIYADWMRAESPRPAEILDVALALKDCAGVLFDTFDKSRPSPINARWSPFFDRVRAAGRFAALAGRIDVLTLNALDILMPDLIAVRGAACRDGDRLAAVDATRVAALARAVRALGPSAVSGSIVRSVEDP